MNKKNAIIIICLLVASLLCLSIPRFFLSPEKKEDESEFEKYLHYKYERVNNCIDPNSEYCMTAVEGAYAVYDYQANIPDVKKMIQTLNKKNQEQKKEDQKHSTLHDEECTLVKDQLKYRYLTKTIMEYLEYKEDIISISQNNVRYDLCKNIQTNTTDNYIYSKKEKKFLTEPEELFKAFHYSKEQIDEIIVRYAKKYEKKEIDSTKIVDYQLVYNQLTQIIILYKIEGSDEWFYAYNKA